jgi:hypothetical protein
VSTALAAQRLQRRAKFSGMDVSLMAKMKELDEEILRLKKLYVDVQMRA